jgi:putative membrane protein
LLFNSKTIFRLLPGLILVGSYVALLIFIQANFPGIQVKIPTSIHSLLGIVLGLLLVFHANTAYERWWEGRRLLGQLVNSSRNLAIKFNTFLGKGNVATKQYLGKLIANYAFAMKEHLREGVIWEELEETECPTMLDLKNYIHVPNRIAGLIYEEANSLYIMGKFTNEQMLILDKQLEVFTDVAGACERIKKTPIPLAYSEHLKKFIFLFILILPMGFIHELKYMAIPVVMIIYYAFVGLQLIGEEIEDPFGNDANDLPTDQICETVRSSVYEILGVRS